MNVRIIEVEKIIADSPWHMNVLTTVRELELPDWMVGAGFVRNAVWDNLHGFKNFTPLADIDVIYFDPNLLDAGSDNAYEQQLTEKIPSQRWSVHNQARMHVRNNDQAYTSCEDAMAHWLETPTCIAVTLTDQNHLKLIAPYGVDDLLTLNVRPTLSGVRKPEIYNERIRTKEWDRTWPKLRIHFPE